MASIQEKLDHLSVRGLDDFAFLVLVAVVFGVPAATVGWEGLFAVGLIFTLIGITFRSKDLFDAHFGRGMSAASDVVEEVVGIYAEKFGVETPKIRVQSRSGMKSDHGKEKYGYVIPNPFDRDIIVLNEVAEMWIESDVIDPTDKRDMLAVVAHEVAHVSQRPRTSLVQSLTLGVPFYVAAGASVVVSSFWIVVGFLILTAIVRKAWITFLFRRSEFDAEKKSVKLAGPEAVLEYYDDIDPVWQPLSSSPSQWSRVVYLEENGLLP